MRVIPRVQARQLGGRERAARVVPRQQPGQQTCVIWLAPAYLLVGLRVSAFPSLEEWSILKTLRCTRPSPKSRRRSAYPTAAFCFSPDKYGLLVLLKPRAPREKSIPGRGHCRAPPVACVNGEVNEWLVGPVRLVDHQLCDRGGRAVWRNSLQTGTARDEAARRPPKRDGPARDWVLAGSSDIARAYRADHIPYMCIAPAWGSSRRVSGARR